jgi:hypothetical protein
MFPAFARRPVTDLESALGDRLLNEDPIAVLGVRVDCQTELRDGIVGVESRESAE